MGTKSSTVTSLAPVSYAEIIHYVKTTRHVGCRTVESHIPHLPRKTKVSFQTERLDVKDLLDNLGVLD